MRERETERETNWIVQKTSESFDDEVATAASNLERIAIDESFLVAHLRSQGVELSFDVSSSLGGVSFDVET